MSVRSVGLVLLSTLRVCRESMAPKQKTSSASSSSADLQSMLNRLQAEGRADDVLSVLEQAFGRKPETNLSMTDASKRRLDESAVTEEDDFEYLTHSGYQAPVPPAAGPAPTMELPAGVTSLARWGQTLCSLPKMASLEKSYAELVELAKTDKNVKGYLESFVLPYNGTSAKTKDLQKYLKATGYKAPAAYYEGTKDARVFKE